MSTLVSTPTKTPKIPTPAVMAGPSRLTARPVDLSGGPNRSPALAATGTDPDAEAEAALDAPKLLAARRLAVTACPYLAVALHAMAIVPTYAVPTMGVDRHWRCYANPAFVRTHHGPRPGRRLAPRSLPPRPRPPHPGRPPHRGQRPPRRHRHPRHRPARPGPPRPRASPPQHRDGPGDQRRPLQGPARVDWTNRLEEPPLHRPPPPRRSPHPGIPEHPRARPVRGVPPRHHPNHGRRPLDRLRLGGPQHPHALGIRRGAPTP